MAKTESGKAMERAFRQAIESANYGPRDYSGRGMYGKSCLAFTINEGGSPFKAAAEIVEAAFCLFHDSLPEELEGLTCEEFLADVVGFCQRARTDSMGLGTVVYFPAIEWED